MIRSDYNAHRGTTRDETRAKSSSAAAAAYTTQHTHHFSPQHIGHTVMYR